MLRVLYATDRLGVHDARFVDALEKAGHSVVTCVDDPAGGWQLADGSTLTETGQLLALRPDVIQAGPLPVAGRLIELAAFAPLVTTCWGTDGYGPPTPDITAALAGSARVICDCSCIAARLARAGARAERIVEFAWGIDLSLFSPSDSVRATAPPNEDEPVTVVTTRSFEPLYDHEVVLRGLALARAAGRDLRLTLHGEGSSSDGLRAAARALGLSDAVTFLPPIPETDLPQVFRSATAWVNASRTDGTAVSLLQALACGTGIVTTDLECARVAAGSAMVEWFAPGDTKGLSEALLRVRRPHPEEIEARRRHLAAFADWHTNAATYVATLEAAAHGSPR